MKATGIVRRIDDLGRVVIPREIRKTLGLKDGDPLEIYTCEDGIYFKKYEADVKQLVAFFDTITTALYKLDIPVALYIDGIKVSGARALPEFSEKVPSKRPCGCREKSNIQLGYDNEIIREENCNDLLMFAAMSIKQKATEIWD